jgi:3-oxoacyl-[acyl-carrier protein] reductase
VDLGLRGKKALVTGASKGIGRACAEVLAEEGCDVMLVSRTVADLEAARAGIVAKHNVAVRVFPLDLSDSGNVDKLADTEILVNNAGAIPGGNIDAIDEARWREGLGFEGVRLYQHDPALLCADARSQTGGHRQHPRRRR